MILNNLSHAPTALPSVGASSALQLFSPIPFEHCLRNFFWVEFLFEQKDISISLWDQGLMVASGENENAPEGHLQREKIISPLKLISRMRHQLGLHLKSDRPSRLFRGGCALGLTRPLSQHDFFDSLLEQDCRPGAAPRFSAGRPWWKKPLDRSLRGFQH